MADSQRTSPWGDAALSVWAILGDRPVAYHPALAKALGNDIPAALFLAQIMYWSDKGTWKPGWVAKTQPDIYNETALTRSQQERVRRKLVKLGVLSEKLMDVPARLYFRVHFPALTKILTAWLKDESDCRKPAIKDEGNPQPKPQKPADQSAGNPQSIPESSTETTPESTPETSGDKSPQVLDEVFGERPDRGKSKILTGEHDLNEQEQAQVAAPGAGQAKPNMDRVQAAWYNTNRNVNYPFGLNWVDVYDYAVLFSELFDIAVPSGKSAIQQWRRGVVDTLCAFADEMGQSGQKPEREQLIRRARWSLQLLHARRIAGDAWTFDIVSPMSTSNTLRVIAGDLRKMQADMIVSDALPDEARIAMYYASKPGQQRPAMSGSDKTEQAILQLEGALELGVPA